MDAQRITPCNQLRFGGAFHGSVGGSLLRLPGGGSQESGAGPDYAGALREYLCDADADSLLTVMKKALERYPSDTAEYARAFEADSVMSEYLAAYHVWNGKFL